MLKPFLVALVCAIPLFATIQAPYLISLTNNATATGSFVTLTWRNNDVATKGFIIYRSLVNPPGPGDLIKTASKEKTSIIDSTAAPKTRYFYSIRGFAESDTSIQSNCDSITTSEILKQNNSRIIDCDWYPDSQYIGLSFVDNCNYEDGYIIKTAKDTNDYVEYNFLKSENPAKMGDSGFVKIRNLECNNWYRVALGVANKGVDTTWFPLCTLFTLKAQPILDSEPVAYLSSLLSEFPLDSNMWSMKIGNDFISAEKNGISVIDISNTSAPKFKKLVTQPYNLSRLFPIGNDLLIYYDYLHSPLIKFYKDSTNPCIVMASINLTNEIERTYISNDSLSVLSMITFSGNTNHPIIKSFELLKVSKDHIVNAMFFNCRRKLYDFIHATIKEIVCKGIFYVNESEGGSHIASITERSSMLVHQKNVANEIDLLSASKDVAPINRVDGIRISGDLTGVSKLFINQKDSIVYLVRKDKLSIYRYSNKPLNNIKILQNNSAIRKNCYIQGHALIVNTEKSSIADIAILNIAGKKLSSIKPLGSTIDLSKSVQAPGLYFITVKTKTGMYSLPYLLQ